MKSGRAGRLAIGVVVALGLLAVFFRGLDWSALRAAFARADPWPLAVVALLTLLLYGVRAARWGRLLRPLAVVPLEHTFSATVIGFMTGLAVPRAQEVLRPYLIARRQPGLRASSAFASIIVERLLDLSTVLLLFGSYFYLWPRPAAEQASLMMTTARQVGVIASLGALAALIMLAGLHYRAEWVLGGAGRVLRHLPARLADPLGELLRSFTEGLAIFKAPATSWIAIGVQSFAVWLLIALSLHLTNRAFGIELPFHATFVMLLFLTVGVAVPTPGMVGGFHTAYLLALTEGFGQPREAAAAAGIASHALANLPVLLAGLLLLPREGLTLGVAARLSEEKAE